MSKIKNGVSLTILGLLLAALGVIAPIIWDWWSKRSEITVETKQSFTLLQKEKSIQKLEIFYGGKSVDSLAKTVLVLKNSGRTPISKDDVVAPLTLTFQKSEVLEVIVMRQTPSNLNAAITTDGHNVAVTFQLLNPDDEIELSVLTNGENPTFDAHARIKSISKILQTSLENQPRVRWNAGVGPYVAGIFGIIFIFGGIGLLLEIPKKNMAKRLINHPQGPIATATSPDQIRDYVTTSLSFYSPRTRSRSFLS